MRGDLVAAHAVGYPGAELSEFFGAGVAGMPVHAPPSCPDETFPAADRFPLPAESVSAGSRSGSSSSGVAARRWARYGSSRARPRAHRLFTVPTEMPRISATSATG